MLEADVGWAVDSSFELIVRASAASGVRSSLASRYLVPTLRLRLADDRRMWGAISRPQMGGMVSPTRRGLIELRSHKFSVEPSQMAPERDPKMAPWRWAGHAARLARRHGYRRC